MKFIIYCIFFQLGTINIGAQKNNIKYFNIEKIEVDDTAYIWSNFDVVLYNKPNKKSNKVGQLKFGDQVVIEDVKLKEYNIKLIDTLWYYKDNLKIKNAPVINYGSWIKVKSLNGKKGYIIDQVVSKIKPDNVNYKQRILPLKPLQTDTIMIDSTSRHYTIYEISYEFEYEIKMIVKNYMYKTIEIEFGNLGKETIWKIMSNYTEKYKGFAVTRNWPNQVFFNDSENYCNYKLIKRDNIFKLKISCNC